jgi:serine/threonine protein kinase
MTRERWDRIKEIFDGALEQDPGCRTRYLMEACDNDTALRAEVESLLSEHERADTFLQTSMLGAADRLVRQRSINHRLFSLGDIAGGRYRAIRLLGYGATGMVFHAFDTRIHRSVAIKTINLLDISDPAEREWHRGRFLKEAQAAGVLSHPGIVTIFDAGETGDLAYIVMELVLGPTLERVLASEPPLDTEVFLSILRQTAAALDYAHRKGIVHRDIKPANIMLDEDRMVKITDFGIAKILATQTTKLGRMVAGTPYYMSPEQIQGKPLNGCSDQFSLAVIAYQILTGQNPFYGERIPALIQKIIHEDVVAPQIFNPTLGRRTEIVLRKAMAKDPAQRFATCIEFAGALEEASRATKGWRVMAMKAGR